MKFFISHKKEDEFSAMSISHTLKTMGIPFYLDLLDNTTINDGKALTDHIRRKLNDCTDIFVVMSSKTSASQWVPFEVGMATQKGLPLATFLQESVRLPDFLDYWPRLKNTQDIITYVSERRHHNLGIFEYRTDSYMSANERIDRFYTAVKRQLL